MNKIKINGIAMMIRFLLFVWLVIPILSQAQSDTASIFMLFRDTTGGKGVVNIHQDPLTRFLIDRDVQIHQKQRGIKDGYRIQIFSSFFIHDEMTEENVQT